MNPSIFTESNKSIYSTDFMGGGTVPLASKMLKRNYIGIELNKKFCDISKQRLKQEVLI